MKKRPPVVRKPGCYALWDARTLVPLPGVNLTAVQIRKCLRYTQHIERKSQNDLIREIHAND